MRILYGVQGTGNGHISRCRTMARALARQGVEVDFCSAGVRRRLFRYDGLRGVPDGEWADVSLHDGRVDLGQTLCAAMAVSAECAFASAGRLRSVITDFEPVTAGQHGYKVPSLGISHQACFAYPIPRRGEDWAARLYSCGAMHRPVSLLVCTGFILAIRFTADHRSAPVYGGRQHTGLSAV